MDPAQNFQPTSANLPSGSPLPPEPVPTPIATPLGINQNVPVPSLTPLAQVTPVESQPVTDKKFGFKKFFVLALIPLMAFAGAVILYTKIYSPILDFFKTGNKPEAINSSPSRSDLEAIPVSDKCDTNSTFQSLAEALKRPEDVCKLVLIGAGLKEIPDGIFNMRNLVRLNLANNEISNISSGMSRLTKLQLLDLSQNKLVNVPEVIYELTSLKELVLIGNGIVEITPSIGKLRSLSSLYLNSNDFKDLPTEVGQLGELSFVSLSNTPVTSLPEDIGKWTKLRLLHLKKTSLTAQEKDKIIKLIPPTATVVFE